MKSLKLGVLFISLTFLSFAQDGISIKIEGQSDDISGGTHTMVAPSHEMFDVLLNIYNNTGEPKDWVITRLKVDVPLGWQDGMCWGHSTDPFGGTCFSSTQMNANPWTSPASQAVLFTINDGEYGKLKPQINPDDWVSGQAHYRYYVSEPGMSYADSVDVIIDFTASLNEIKPASIGITPNPASNVVQICLQNATSARYSLVDIFGKQVMKGTLSKNTKLDVSKLKGGPYFMYVDVKNQDTFSQKLLIQR